MPISPVSVIYTVAGGLILYSGVKGDTLADMAHAVLTGNLSGLKSTQTIDFSSPTSSGTGSPGSPANASTGSTTVNGTSIYKYLRAQGWTPIQAAGAIAAMWGESTWSPEAQEKGGTGKGIMQWSFGIEPVQITGNPTADLNQQLPLILDYINKQGDNQYLTLMNGTKSVTTAANIFGQKIERFGVNDVHSQGVSAALAISKTVDPGAGLTT